MRLWHQNSASMLVVQKEVRAYGGPYHPASVRRQLWNSWRRVAPWRLSLNRTASDAYQLAGKSSPKCAPLSGWSSLRSFALVAEAGTRLRKFDWEGRPKPTSLLKSLKGMCLLHLLSENIFTVLRSNWFYVLMKQKRICNLSLCYFSLFCFYLTGYDGRTAERKSDSTWRTWYKQTLRVYYSRRPISWLIPEMQYPVIYIIKFSNN